MIIVLKKSVTEKQLQHIVDSARAWGLKTNVSRGVERTIIGLIGDEREIRGKPLDMLPGGWGTLVRLTPFQYLAYFPAAVFLGKIQGAALIGGLVVEFAWVVVSLFACRFLFYLGAKRYSGYGG